MFIARWQRLETHDPYLIPHGKVLETEPVRLVWKTASAHLRWQRADIILVNMFTPQAVPLAMATSRLACLVRGADVKTVMVQGQILMEDRKVKTVNETDV